MDYLESQDDSGYGEDNSTPSSIHPDRYDHDHIISLEIFSKDLQKAISNSFPRPKTLYTAVHVLLLRWAEDDLNVQEELATLKRVFESQFRFATEQWDIPSQNSTRALQTKLYNFQDTHQSEDELLIVYYGGHGDADRRRGRSIWAANKQPDSPTLTWSSLQHLLENAIPHVLIILDCCYAANAARDTSEGTTKELLAACGRENPTLGVGIRSFTSAVIEELQAFGNCPFTVAMLHSRLITMRWRLAFTPVYALLSEHGGHSIELIPLSSPTLTVQPHNQSASDTDDDMMDISSPEAKIAVDTRVLLSVSIADDAVCDIAQWKKWLVSQAPWDVTKIEVKVEAVFKSHSTMLITSLPIVAWDNLPDKAAYRFVGFVKSENLGYTPSPPKLASGDPKSDYKYACTATVGDIQCTKRFRRKTDLDRHYQSVHLKARIHKCDLCGNLFARREMLRRHNEDGCPRKRFELGFREDSAMTPGWRSPDDGWRSPDDGWRSPDDGWRSPDDGWRSPDDGWQSPDDGWRSPDDGWQSPDDGWQSPDDYLLQTRSYSLESSQPSPMVSMSSSGEIRTFPPHIQTRSASTGPSSLQISRDDLGPSTFHPTNQADHSKKEHEVHSADGQVVWVAYRRGQGWLFMEDPKSGAKDLIMVPEEHARLLQDINIKSASLDGGFVNSPKKVTEIKTPPIKIEPRISTNMPVANPMLKDQEKSRTPLAGRKRRRLDVEHSRPESLMEAPAISSTLSNSISAVALLSKISRSSIPSVETNSSLFVPPSTMYSTFGSSLLPRLPSITLDSYIRSGNETQPYSSLAHPGRNEPPNQKRFQGNISSTTPVQNSSDRKGLSEIPDYRFTTAWSVQMDNTLQQAPRQGLAWKEIAERYFPSKTANACRKRHERLMEKSSQEYYWDEGKLEGLAVSYRRLRERMWMILAEHVGKKWRLVEAKCMETGLKTLLNTARKQNSTPSTFGSSVYTDATTE
ncbi:MAG: hypothetical protein Q9166_002865 [cf. Caloplaca sp. 2 TL-2023]